MRALRLGDCVAHDCAQPTLDQTLGLSPSDAIASLSLTEAAACLAFERATHSKAPITTSLRLTYALFQALSDRGIYRLDIGGRGPTVRRAIYDPLSWTCELVVPGCEDLETLLLARVRDLAARDDAEREKISLWRALAYGEAESYLAAQLRRHGFDPTWAERIHAGLEREWDELTLARRRYLIWAGVRQGAAVYMQSAGDITQSFSAIQTELRRRGRWLSANDKPLQPAGQGFLPYAAWTRPLLLDIYLDEISKTTEAYWTETIPPRAEPTS